MRRFNDDDDQNARLDEVDRRTRRMTERIAQLSIDLGQTLVEL